MFATELLIRYPEALEIEDAEAIHLAYPGLTVTDYNKLVAAVTLVTTDFFWAEVDRFNVLCNAIAKGLTYPGGYLLPEIDTIGWAIVEAVILTPELDDCVFRDKQIEDYIIMAAKHANAFPFTLRRFVDWPDKDKYDSPELNNFLVFHMKDYLDAIRQAFASRQESLNAISEADLEKRIRYFQS